MDFDKYIAEQQAALDKMQREMEQQLAQAQQMATQHIEEFQNAHKKYCPECGAQMESYASFCPECGAQVGNAAPTNTESNAIAETPAPAQESDQPQGGLIDFCDYEGWCFNYTYESGGMSQSINVFIMCEDDGLFFLYDMPLSLSEDDFKHCQDIHDCGVVIAKHVIKDNDGEVMMNFNCDGDTLTNVGYNITLTPDLDYAPLDESNEMVLTLGADCDMDAKRCDIYELDEEFANRVKDCIEEGDIDGIYNFIDCEDQVIEFLGLWGDDDECLSYELYDSDGELIDDGEIQVAEKNVFQYSNFRYEYGSNKHPQYLLVRTDIIKRSVTSFTVPAGFEIGGVHFEKYNFIEGELYGIGDTITIHDNLHFAGKVYSSDNIEDGGTLGATNFDLLEWNDDLQRYECIASTNM